MQRGDVVDSQEGIVVFAEADLRPFEFLLDEAVAVKIIGGLTSVPTLVEQSQLVGVGDGDFLMQIIMKQAIDGGFLEQAEAQNL